jgi:tetratricopeptide (TPR) repeat protein
VAYEQIGQPDRALEDYKRAVAIDPQLSNVYINRGVTFGQMGNLQQSIASLTEAIRLAPRNPDGYFNRGIVYFQHGDFGSAIEDLSTVIQLSPGDEEAYYWRGIAREQTGHQRAAIDDYRQFLALSRDEDGRAEIEQRLSQLDEGKQKGSSAQSFMPDDRQNTDRGQSETTEGDIDLHDLIVALGERALNSIWFGSGVDCHGEKAEELYAVIEQDRPIEGRDLLSIARGIRQTMAGDFQAFDPGENAPWIFLRAWEGTGFYVETNDPRSKQQLKTRFPSVEEVEGASPPFEGLFIRIK